jgi:hypothetical protein
MAKQNRNLRRAKKTIAKKKTGNGYAASRSARILYQGVATTARKNFGSADMKKTKIAALVRALDAKVPRTLGLPRAVGPYTIIRTNTLVSSKDGGNFVMFCPLVRELDSSGTQWMTSCGIMQAGAGSSAVGATNGAYLLKNPVSQLGDAAEVVPAAMTVQCVNAKPLDSAGGSYFMGRVNQPMDFGSSSTVTWNTLRSNFISYFSPRMLAGGKLALRGVQCSAYPLDMTEYSAFQGLNSGGVSDTSPTTWEHLIKPGALTPIVFVSNAQMVEDSVQWMVTIEWRVRFDPANPAVASHQHHDTLCDEAWNDVVKVASAAGHGVEELAESVAAGGALVAGVARAGEAMAMA